MILPGHTVVVVDFSSINDSIQVNYNSAVPNDQFIYMFYFYVAFYNTHLAADEVIGEKL